MSEWGFICTPECSFLCRMLASYCFKVLIFNKCSLSRFSPSGKVARVLPFFLFTFGPHSLSLFPSCLYLTRRLPESTPSAPVTSGMPCRPGISSRPVASFIAELGSWRAPMISPFNAESLRFAAAAGWDPVAPRASPHLSAVPSANFGAKPRRVMSRRFSYQC